MFFKKKTKTTKPVKEEVKETTEIKTSVPPPRPTKIAHKVLIRPVITEKATQLSTLNQYVFEISVGINKIEVKKAIKELYGFQPIKVNIIKVKGRAVRYGRSRGRTKNWLKAIITLKKGEKIDLGLA